MFRFPAKYRHEHPSVRNVNELSEEALTLGDRLADAFARTVGSWTFIIIQTFVLTGWIVVNVVAWARHWDPYPFILLNLALSFQAAYSAPVIMMSENREAKKDRLRAEQDFQVNLKAEKEVALIIQHLEAQNEALEHVHDDITKLMAMWSGQRGKEGPAGQD